MDAATPFRALCEDVLGARVAYLVALGLLAPLVGPPLAYPDDASISVPPLTEITAQFRSPQTMWVPLDPTRRQSVQGGAVDYGSASWAVPLWSERGLIGVLLLGAKRDGGLYTQEEIEIARASGERLIDTQASAEMARRLMALQRQRLAESQVLDRRARRVLHDDVLPRLHTAMLTLRGSQFPPSVPPEGGEDVSSQGGEDVPPQGGEDVPPQGGEDIIGLLAGVHRQISDLLREMPTSTAPQVARLGLFGALQRVVDEELGNAFDRVTWRVEPEAERETGRIPSLTAEVLFYAAREAIRNAAHHGRDAESSRPLYLDIFAARRDGLQIYIQDNGVGLGGHVRQGLRPPPGSGQGLALHGTMMAVVGGSLSVESVPGEYTRVTLVLPQETW
jgi:anti-sigma regulatory factor (Ser/Thr protein kinase)